MSAIGQDPPTATDRAERSRFRAMIGSALFEAAFIVFGVVVAYLANEWREKRVHRQDAAAARAAILREFGANREAAKVSSDYHRMIIDSLIARGQARIPSDIRLFSRGFYLPAQLGSTAWEVAEQTGALTHMPFDEVLRYSHVYAVQRTYQQQIALAGAVIYQELYRAGAMDMASRGGQMLNLITTFQFRERGIVALYDSVLALPPVAMSVTPETRRAP